jgi:hypothetical protein
MHRSGVRYASGMDILKMLAELNQKRTQIEEAILTNRNRGGDAAV